MPELKLDKPNDMHPGFNHRIHLQNKFITTFTPNRDINCRQYILGTFELLQNFETMKEPIDFNALLCVVHYRDAEAVDLSLYNFKKACTDSAIQLSLM